VTIMFRGREMARTELGRKILDRLVADLADSAVVESLPKQEGGNRVMVLAPTKKHPEPKGAEPKQEERPAAPRAAAEPTPEPERQASSEVAAAPAEQPQET